MRLHTIIQDGVNVKLSTISDHSLVSLSLNLKPPKLRPTYVYNPRPENFVNDLATVPFHMISFFVDFDDKVYAYNCLFLDVLNYHAPFKRTKIKRNDPIVAETPIPQVLLLRLRLSRMRLSGETHYPIAIVSYFQVFHLLFHHSLCLYM